MEERYDSEIQRLSKQIVEQKKRHHEEIGVLRQELLAERQRTVNQKGSYMYTCMM